MANLILTESTAVVEQGASAPVAQANPAAPALHDANDQAMNAHTAADGAPHGGEHAEPSFMGVGPGAWVALAMLLLLAIMLWKRVPGMIGKMLDGKIAAIRHQLDEASALRQEAEALKGEYEAKLRALDSETAAMRTRAQEEADLFVAKAKTDADDLIARRRKMAEERIAAAERTAVAEVREHAAKASVAAAEHLLRTKHDAQADKSLIDQAIAQVGRA